MRHCEDRCCVDFCRTLYLWAKPNIFPAECEEILWEGRYPLEELGSKGGRVSSSALSDQCDA